MANLTAAIQRIKRTRNRLDAPDSRNFETYRSDYEAILEEAAALADDDVFDSLLGWMQEATREHQRLPRPEQVRAKARALCREAGVSIPESSPLRA